MSSTQLAKKVRVLIADDMADTRENLTKLLYFEKDIEVIGGASDGQQAVDLAKKSSPDIVLLDLNMPVVDGIAAAAAIRESGCGSAVIMMSVQDDVQYFRQAMLAGAREFLTKPFTGQDLIGAIRRVYEHSERPSAARVITAPTVSVNTPVKNGRIVTVFGPKGGVGRTTIAVNLAVALRNVSGKDVALVDGNLQFGDDGVLLSLQPQKTIVDLLPHVSALDPEIFDDLLLRHDSGVRVLLAPARPEMAELITPEIFNRILTKLRESSDYVVVDTFPSFQDTMLGTLDVSDQVLVVFTCEMTAIKNVRNFVDVTRALGYPREKLTLVLNRADSAGGIKASDIEKTLGHRISGQIVSDYRLVTSSLNAGVPVVSAHPKSKVAQCLVELAQRVAEVDPVEAASGGKLARASQMLKTALPFRRREATRQGSSS